MCVTGQHVKVLRRRVAAKTRAGIDKQRYAVCLGRSPRLLERLSGAYLTVRALQDRVCRAWGRNCRGPGLEIDAPEVIDRDGLMAVGVARAGGGVSGWLEDDGSFDC